MESNGLVSLVQKWNRIKFRCHRFPLWWWYFTGVQKKMVVAKSWLTVISKPLDKANLWIIYRSTVLSTGAPQKLKRAAQSWEVRVISPSLGQPTTNQWSGSPTHLLLTSRYMSVGEPDYQSVAIIYILLLFLQLYNFSSFSFPSSSPLTRLSSTLTNVTSSNRHY